MRFLPLWVLVSLAGCSPGAPGPSPDAARPDPDGGGSAGLAFVWELDKALPAEIGKGTSITSIELRMREVRAIGDGAPGDDRTTRAALTVTWSGPGSKPQDPASLELPQAPPGLYSRLEGRLDGAGLWSYRVHGQVRWSDGELRAFVAEDTARVVFSIALHDIALEAGAEQQVAIRVRADFIRSVDWSDVEPDDEGILQLEDDDQLEDVREDLATAFDQT